MIEMKNIYGVLNMNDDQMNTFICLINEGYTNEEAINAINLINNNNNDV